jgi:hypothetical protein
MARVSPSVGNEVRGRGSLAPFSVRRDRDAPQIFLSRHHFNAMKLATLWSIDDEGWHFDHHLRESEHLEQWH